MRGFPPPVNSSEFLVVSKTVVYILTCKCVSFPRNIGMGTSTGAARIGAFCSPYIVYLVSRVV